ncbi:hypothetical protein EIP91_006033 [Steccherinum ochraceum]|uniref:Uncharacterized protein n=1 Tax=Steccherinum ochraceum TaxID=92696 RepID=A0A4V6N730_9APHY|nr:hypothetical protein EIP91_006033 [Steccherinum ochraceum]
MTCWPLQLFVLLKAVLERIVLPDIPFIIFTFPAASSFLSTPVRGITCHISPPRPNQKLTLSASHSSSHVESKHSSGSHNLSPSLHLPPPEPPDLRPLLESQHIPDGCYLTICCTVTSVAAAGFEAADAIPPPQLSLSVILQLNHSQIDSSGRDASSGDSAVAATHDAVAVEVVGDPVVRLGSDNAVAVYRAAECSYTFTTLPVSVRCLRCLETLLPKKTTTADGRSFRQVVSGLTGDDLKDKLSQLLGPSEAKAVKLVESVICDAISHSCLYV